MSRRYENRAFALPLVLLLALVASIGTMMLLDRQSAQTRMVERQIQGYRDRHFERGVREIVGQWSDTVGGSQWRQRVDKSNGHALSIALVDGSVLEVYLFDAQGSILTDPSGKESSQVELARTVAESLGQDTNWNPDPVLLRPVGPVAVSALAAPAEVLTAVARAARAREPARFADAIIRARDDLELSESEWQTALGLADPTAEVRTALAQMVTINPTLVGVVVDVYAQGASGPTLRYGGRFDVQAPSASGGLVQSLGKFLTWEELPVDGE